jgi:hypothetical protein
MDGSRAGNVGKFPGMAGVAWRAVARRPTGEARVTRARVGPPPTGRGGAGLAVGGKLPAGRWDALAVDGP